MVNETKKNRPCHKAASNVINVDNIAYRREGVNSKYHIYNSREIVEVVMQDLLAKQGGSNGR